MPEIGEVQFKHLSGWLKIAAVGGWIMFFLVSLSVTLNIYDWLAGG